MKEKATVHAPNKTWHMERRAILILHPLMLLEMNFSVSLFFINTSTSNSLEILLCYYLYLHSSLRDAF